MTLILARLRLIQFNELAASQLRTRRHPPSDAVAAAAAAPLLPMTSNSWTSPLEFVAKGVRRTQLRQDSNGYGVLTVSDHVQSKQEGDGGGGEHECTPTIQHESKRVMVLG